MKLLNTTRWEKQRAKGFRHFVFVTGILCFGVPLAVLIVAVRWWQLQHVGFFEHVPAFRSDFARIGIAIVTVGGPLIGVVWGLMTWKANEWLYRRYRESTGAEGKIGGA